MVRRVLLLLCSGALAAPSAAAAQAPPGPPGPPPGAGADLPTAPGTAPAFVPAGTAASVPVAGASGPGLLDGSAVVVDRRRRTATLALACRARGTVALTAPALGRGTVASGVYRCADGRAAVRLSFKRAAVRRLPRQNGAAATAVIRERGRTARRSVLLRRTAAPSPAFWTDGHLHCAPDAPAGAAQAFFVVPDFTARGLTPLSTRSWIAWYTPGGGWRWLGARGEDAGRWDTWTATPAGIAQFHPGDAVNPVPWTWGPIAFPAGREIVAAGVVEIVYWGAGRPAYQWGYVNAGPVGAAATGGGAVFCAYP